MGQGSSATPFLPTDNTRRMILCHAAHLFVKSLLLETLGGGHYLYSPSCLEEIFSETTGFRYTRVTGNS